VGPVSDVSDLSGSLAMLSLTVGDRSAVWPCVCFQTRPIGGRLFDRHDGISAPRVSVVSKTLDERYFPHRNLSGQSLKFDFRQAPVATNARSSA